MGKKASVEAGWLVGRTFSYSPAIVDAYSVASSSARDKGLKLKRGGVAKAKEDGKRWSGSSSIGLLFR